MAHRAALQMDAHAHDDVPRLAGGLAVSVCNWRRAALRKVALCAIRSHAQTSRGGPRRSGCASAALLQSVERAQREAATCDGLCLARTSATSWQRLSPLHWSLTLALTPGSTSQDTASRGEPPTWGIVAGASQGGRARTDMPARPHAHTRARPRGASAFCATGLWLLSARATSPCQDACMARGHTGP